MRSSESIQTIQSTDVKAIPSVCGVWSLRAGIVCLFLSLSFPVFGERAGAESILLLAAQPSTNNPTVTTAVKPVKKRQRRHLVSITNKDQKDPNVSDAVTSKDMLDSACFGGIIGGMLGVLMVWLLGGVKDLFQILITKLSTLYYQRRV